jgi:hypothetical protein
MTEMAAVTVALSAGRQAASFVPLNKYYLGDLIKEKEACGVSGVVGETKEIY